MINLSTIQILGCRKGGYRAVCHCRCQLTHTLPATVSCRKDALLRGAAIVIGNNITIGIQLYRIGKCLILYRESVNKKTIELC